MKKHIMGFVRSILFLAILFTSLFYINTMLRPKYTPKNSSWPTSGYYQFYKMREHSVDVLFLGSSVTVNAFSPQEIYNKYGIRSYNLGSEQQSPICSYYWLKEALRFQKPQVVLLDTRFFLDLHPNLPLNMREPMIRKCIDPMQWSSVKEEAVKDICSIDPSQSEMSYYLTNLRFHERWESADEADADTAYYSSSALKGHSALPKYGEKEYKTFQPDPNNKDAAKLQKLTLPYMERIAALCRENGITLVLLSLPGNAMNNGINNTIRGLAQQYGLDYYNFCETEMYRALGAELPRENTVDHANLWGAIRISDYTGRLLFEKYHVAPVVDTQYEETKAAYQRVKDNCELTHIVDPHSYFELVRKNGYSVLFASGKNSYKQITDAIQIELRGLGLTTDLRTIPNYGYAAVYEPASGVNEMKAVDDDVILTGSLSGHTLPYKITGSGADHNSTIVFKEQTYKQDDNGLNLLVYDPVTDQVLDTATITSEGLTR